MMKAKRYLARLLALAFIFTLAFTSLPMNAYAGSTVTINLKVKNGQDIVTAFNNATIKAKDNKKGRIYKIVVPKGSYKAKNQLKIWSNTILVLNGVTIKHTSGATTMFRLGNKSDWDKANKGKGYPGYSGYKNITIQGGILDGGGYSQAIMRFGHTTNVKIEGTTFKNVKNAHHMEIGACKDFVINKCVFSDFNGDWGSTRNYEALQLEALAGDHFSAYNPNKDETPNQNITIQNCQFNNLQRALGTHTGINNSYFSNIVIKNNVFTNVTGYAVIATNYKNSVISNNRIENCGAGIYFRTMEPGHNNFYATKVGNNNHKNYVSLNCKIENNIIRIKTGHRAKYKNIAYGIQLFGEILTGKKGNAPKGDFRVAGVTVNKNIVNMYVTGYGIWVNGGSANTISNNNVNINALAKSAGTNCDGIRIDGGSYNKLLKNRITNYTKSTLADSLCGITVSNSYAVNVNGNVTINTKLDGIKLYKSGSSKVTNNSVTGASRDGICVSTLNYTTVQGNTITNGKRHGINVNACKSIKILKNKIKNCAKNGINAAKNNLSGEAGNNISVRGKPRSWR